MENKNIMVGRHQELVLLQEIISSPKAELVPPRQNWLPYTDVDV